MSWCSSISRRKAEEYAVEAFEVIRFDDGVLGDWFLVSVHLSDDFVREKLGSLEHFDVGSSGNGTSYDLLSELSDVALTMSVFMQMNIELVNGQV